MIFRLRLKVLYMRLSIRRKKVGIRNQRVKENIMLNRKGERLSTILFINIQKRRNLLPINSARRISIESSRSMNLRFMGRLREKGD